MLLLLPTLFAAASAQDSSDCALIVTIPPEAGTFQFRDRRVCITYDNVNAAFIAAQEKVGKAPSNKLDQIVGNLGTVISETSRVLSKKFGLPSDAIANGLPLIDTTRTFIHQQCPSFLMKPSCAERRYRSVDGICNNLRHPHWGAAMNGHHRYLAPDYQDGVSSPRASSTGHSLPSPRAVSSNIHKDSGHHDHIVTLQLVAWGQFIDHDITLSAETKDPLTGKTPKCCEGSSHQNCFPIDIPASDPFYKKHKMRCMNFVRHMAGLKEDCKLGPREQFNEISSFIDGGTVYSSNPEKQQQLRLHKGGLLKSLPVFKELNMKDLMPLNLEEPDEGCLRPHKDVFCFLAGDVRNNENMILTMMHTLFMREHNRMAEIIAEINPHWSDETIFQEVKHINAAQIQHITYNEFLPMVLGRKVMHEHELVLLKDDYFMDYDPNINPSAAAGFTTAAYRFGHSLLPSSVEQWSKNHKKMGSKTMSELFFQPYDLLKPGVADHYMMGLVNQVAQAEDSSMSHQLTNHLFQEPGKKFGLDLAALNIQRGREHGIPSYNRWRAWCGLQPARTWEDLVPMMGNRTVRSYSKLYGSPEDLDLWSAGISELPLAGSMVGPTFACIIGKQFHNFRFGDRFWYEGGGRPSSFTREQLAEIRRVKLSTIICDNTDEIDDIQVYAMVLKHHNLNPRVACKSGVLPRINLNRWRDASFHRSIQV